MHVQMRRLRRRWKPYLCLPTRRGGDMDPALGQTPSMRNRQGQHLVHELYCGFRHHPEGLDDRLTLISIGGLQHSLGRQLGSQDERFDDCQPAARQIPADPSTIDSAESHKGHCLWQRGQPDACLAHSAPMTRGAMLPERFRPAGLKPPAFVTMSCAQGGWLAETAAPAARQGTMVPAGSGQSLRSEVPKGRGRYRVSVIYG